MTDQNFQTPPLPPKAPSFAPVDGATSVEDVKAEKKDAPVAEQQDITIPADNFATRLKLPVKIYKTKMMAAILCGTAVVGILLGAMIFGGSSAPMAQGPRGLLGVVGNPDIRSNLGRCGTVREDEACVVYIVNHSRNDKRAGAFFKEAVKLTGRQEYMVQIANKQYVNTLIPPGYIAQIQVPPLR